MQMAQAGHALIEFAVQLPELTGRWYTASRNLVVLQVSDEVELADVVARAHEAGVDHVLFREPDLHDELTAVALAPAASSMVANLPLAGRDLAMI